jgi:hypothetical protein
MEATMDDLIFMGARIGCRALELVRADTAKAAVCAPGDDHRYLVGIFTWILIATIVAEIGKFFFKPQSDQPNSRDG